MRHVEITPRVFQAGKKCTFRLKGASGNMSVRIAYKNSAEVLYAANSSDITEISTVLPHTGEYYIFLSARGTSDRRISVYGVSEEMAGLLPVKGDLHIHTLYSDGAQSPREMVIQARRLGMDYIAVTDHDSYYPSLEAIKFTASSGLSILCFEGEEVTVPTGGHVLSIGSDSPLHLKDMDADTLKEMIEAQAAETDIILLEQGLSPYTYGGMKLVMKMIKEKGGFSVLCHPFWMVEHTGFYHLPRPMLKQAVKDRLPNAIEIPGDTLHQDNMLGLSFYYGHTDRSIPIVANSDTHSTTHTFGQRWQIAFVPVITKESILSSVSTFMSAACERQGENICVYGSLGLVEYSYFLIREFFPYKDKLANTEAELYASGLLTDDIRQTSESYIRSFFGFQPLLAVL